MRGLCRLIVVTVSLSAACEERTGSERVNIRGPIEIKLDAITGTTPVVQVPSTVAVDEREWTYISDDQGPQILVLDSAGSVVRTVGRRGEGPGEFRQAAIGVGDGHLYVHDIQLSRVSKFDTSGKLAWTRKAPCCLPMAVRIDRQGRAYLRKSALNWGNRDVGDAFLVIDSLGKDVRELARPELPLGAPTSWVIVNPAAALNVAIPYAPRVVSAVTREGTLVYGNSTSDTLEWQTTEGRGVWALPHVPALAVSDQLKKEAMDGILTRYSRFLPKEVLLRSIRMSEIPSTAPRTIHIDSDICDRLWIARTDGRVDGKVRFDILTSKGKPLATASVNGVLGSAPLFAVGRSTMTAIMLDKDDVPEIRRFNIRPATLGCP